MAPVEDLQSRDLAWISDFVMQQMVIMLRPMMEHLHQTDASVDYVQHSMQRLSMDVSDLRADLDRTNKYLSILRQGLGVQNEGKCVLQRGLEATARTVKRHDEQVDTLLEAVRIVEGSVGRLGSDVRAGNGRQDDLARQVALSASALEDLQGKFAKDDFVRSEAQSRLLDVWAPGDLRDLRRGQLGGVPLGSKLDAKEVPPSPSSQSGRALSSAAFGNSQPCALESWPPQRKVPRSSSRAGRMWGGGSAAFDSYVATASDMDGGSSGCHPSTGSASAGEEAASSTSRLPLLAGSHGRGTVTCSAPRGSSAVSAESSATGYSDGPRLRFSATMASKPPTRGSGGGPAGPGGGGVS